MADTSNAPLKLLFAGHVGHHYDVLFSKVSKLVAKKGPFDALFAFADPGGGSAAALAPYLSGEKPLPIPTYVVGRIPDGANIEAAVASSAHEVGGRGQPRIQFLGGGGSSLATIRGLKVAFLEGRYNASAYG